MKLSNRSQVDSFIVMDVMEAARLAEAEGRRIVHMEVGQPGTAAPKQAQARLSRQMSDDALGYTVALGLPDLRQGIANLYQDWYGVDLDPNRVVVTSGSSAGFLLTFSALFDAGAKVGIGAPGYPSYRQILKALSLSPVDIPTREAAGFQPELQDIDKHDLSGLLVASPANPTGTMLSESQLRDLIVGCADRDISFISDEIYHGIEYEKKAVTALQLSDDVYVINSFSKYFSMTGWRVGWMVVPEDHIRTVERLAQNMFICPPHASQVAALGALESRDELNENLAVYRKNRDLMRAGLIRAGLPGFSSPDGAFYYYVDVSEFSNDSLALSKDILAKAGVAVTPGLDFDPERGHKYLRFSYARATADIEEGLKKLITYFTDLKDKS